MPHVRSFAPIARKDATVLILGSMPGTASLAATQYYAHPQNAFWRIMGDILEFDPAAPYPARLRALERARIAVWDVLRSCRREGSLDSSIERETQVANDFRRFYRAHPLVGRVFFNGAASEQCYRRHVLGAGIGDHFVYERLPSTSPANASWSYARKLEMWREALTRRDVTGRGRA